MEMLLQKRVTQENVPAMMECLGLVNQNVLDVYIQGSWLWGTAKNTSDLDLLVVHNDRTKPGKISTKGHSGKVGPFDAQLLRHDEYLDRLKNECVQEVLTLFQPEHTILRRTLKLEPKLSAVGFASQVLEECQSDEGRLQKSWEHGNIKQAKRVLVFALRSLMFAKQLFRHGRINDFTVANDARMGILNIHGHDREAYVEFEMQYNLLKSQVETLLGTIQS